MARTATTAWGTATIVEEVTLPQRAGEKRFTSLVQLLEDGGGKQYVRFAYATEGTARRGPVTLRREDLKRLASALAHNAGLASALALDPAAPPRGGGRRASAR